MKKILVLAAAAAGVAKLLSSRKATAKQESSELWREAVKPPTVN
ncbi:MAG: DLW-39 family protein [Actinomycetota bacterium]|nr:DLW-39 family protein [Actinomycetota bacterium]